LSLVTPFPFQQRAYEDLMAYLYANPGKSTVVEAPTASGKSVIVAWFCSEVLKAWPNQRILMLVHVKELVAQNEERLLDVWPESPVGVYAAGMKRKELDQPIVFASVQSLARAKSLPHFDVVIVDECHRVPFLVTDDEDKPKSQYQQVFERLGNPVVVGLTATPYRTGGGPIVRDGETDPEELSKYVFDDICHSISVKELLDLKRVAPVKSVGSKSSVDLSSIKIVRGEYDENQMANAFMSASGPILDEVVKRGNACDRKKWIIFCSNVEHVEQTVAGLEQRGIAADYVVGTHSIAERDETVRRFKAGEFQALVNCAVFTTGFDVPDVDMVVMLRATQSTVLHVQIIGRGMRVAPGKEYCLLLDYGSNVRRHGPIDKIKVHRRKKRGVDEPQTKECPECEALIAMNASECPECGHSFASDAEKDHWDKLDLTADSTSPMAATAEPRWHDVKRARYSKHVKQATGAESMKVSYVCGLQTFNEWVTIGRDGGAGIRAARWWSDRGGNIPTPTSVDDALHRSHELREPRRICVSQNGRFFQVDEVRFFEAAA